MSNSVAGRHLPVRLVLVLLTIGLLSAACGTSAVQTERLVPKPGGTAIVATVSDPADCWPLRHASLNSMSSLVHSAVLPSAFVLSEQGIWTLNRSLFSQVELSSTDPQIVVYTLNSNAVWADGTPITASDLIANWRAGMATSLPTALGYRAIASLVPSGHPGLVVATFAAPYADWRTLFSDLLPASVLAKGPQGCTLPRATIDVSGGPFVVSSASREEVRLVRNPKWWGPPVSLDRLVIRRSSSTTTAVELVVHNRAQVATVSNFSTQDVLRASQSPRTTVSVGQSSAMVHLVPGLRRGPLAQLPLRQLVAAAVDRAALGQAIVGQSTTNVGVLSSALFAGLSTLENGFDQDPPTRPTPVKPLDPAIAAAAGSIGYSFQAGHWVNRSGAPLLIRIGIDRSLPFSHTFALTLFDQLKSAGISSVFIEQMGTEGAARALKAGAVDAALIMRVAPQAPSQEAPWFVMPQNGGVSLENPGAYENADVAALFASASGQLNPVDANDAYSAIDSQIASDVAAIPLVSLPTLQVWRTRLRGVSIFPFGGSLTQGAERWSILVSQNPGQSATARLSPVAVAN